MPYNRKEEKEQQLQKLKQKIFDTTMEMLHERSFADLTIREICASVQISTGMFYKLYSSKLELLSYYYDKLVEDYPREYDEELSSLPIKEQLIAFYRWVCDFTQSLGDDFCRNFFDSKNEVMDANLFQNQLMLLTDSLLEKASQEGLILSRPPHEISKDLCVIVKGVIFDWSARHGGYDMSAFAVRLLSQVISPLLA